MPTPPIQKQLVEKLMQAYCDKKILQEIDRDPTGIFWG